MPRRDQDDVGLEVTQQLRQGPPAIDTAGLEALRAGAEEALCNGAQPATGGRFVLVGRVAAGGMGVVYRAYDPQLDREVALKVIKPGACHDRQAREWMLTEARLLARLQHPNVVSIHDVVLVDDQVVLVLELVAGQTLDAWEVAAARGWRELVSVYVAAGRGLAAAAACGLVHRDFKPANVIVGDDGRVRVIDFGLAQPAGASEGGAVPPPTSIAGATPRPGVVVGTPVYMAPEQMTGDGPSPAADQFSFCVALYQALYGVRPYAGDDLLELQASIRAGLLVAPPEPERVPARLHALVVRGLAADPAERHPSLAALLDELERVTREPAWPVGRARPRAEARARLVRRRPTSLSGGSRSWRRTR